MRFRNEKIFIKSFSVKTKISSKMYYNINVWSQYNLCLFVFFFQIRWKAQCAFIQRYQSYTPDSDKYIALKWFNQSMNYCDQGDIHVITLKWMINVREVSCNAIATTFDAQNVCSSLSLRHAQTTFINRRGKNMLKLQWESNDKDEI